MAPMRFGQFLTYVLALTNTAYLAVRGYQRRRPHWTRPSWWRFAATCVLALTLIAAGLAMTVAVDRGIFATAITTRDGRSFWILGTLALVVAGACGLALTLSWFAFGAAARPFPGASMNVRRR